MDSDNSILGPAGPVAIHIYWIYIGMPVEEKSMPFYTQPHKNVYIKVETERLSNLSAVSMWNRNLHFRSDGNTFFFG